MLCRFVYFGNGMESQAPSTEGKAHRSSLKALALFRKLLLLLGPELSDEVLGPELSGVAGLRAVNIIAEHIDLGEDISVGPLALRRPNAAAAEGADAEGGASAHGSVSDFESSQFAASVLSELSLNLDWMPALQNFSQDNLTVDILPSPENALKEGFSTRLRKGAVALGLWGGWASLPQVSPHSAVSGVIH